jgi:isochorismate synthase
MHLELRNAYLKIDSPSLQDLIEGAIAKAQNLDRSIILTYSYAWENIDPLFFLNQKSQSDQPRFYWEQPQQKMAIAAGGMVIALPQLESFQALSEPSQCAEQSAPSQSCQSQPLDPQTTASTTQTNHPNQPRSPQPIIEPSSNQKLAHLEHLDHLEQQFSPLEPDAGLASDRFSLAREWVKQWLSTAVVGAQTDCQPLKPYIIGGFSFYDRPSRQRWQDFPAVRLFMPRWLLRKQSDSCTIAINCRIHPHDQPQQVEATLSAIYADLCQDYDQTQTKTLLDSDRSDRKTNPNQRLRLVDHSPASLTSLPLIHQSSSLKSAPQSQPSQQSQQSPQSSPTNHPVLSDFNHDLTGDLKPEPADQNRADRSSIEINEVSGDRPWTDAVKQAVSKIKAGRLDKVVLARALDITAQHNFDPSLVLDSLRQSYPQCINFAINFGGEATFLGATPELLLEFKHTGDDLALKSDAVAGSTGRSSIANQDRQMGDRLLHSSKDLNEHKIVVKSICDRLHQLGATITPTRSPQLLKLSNVQHLHTPITATLNTDDWLVAFDILAQLHPTAAVGGEPRQVAIEVMQTLEKCDRGWYAAPIGWVNGDGEGAFAVGIRSGYLAGNQARLYAGAGIVADSKFDAELGETTIKFDALFKALGISG